MKNAKTMLRKILLIGAVITAMTVTGCKQPVKKDKGGEVKTFAVTVTQPLNGTITVKKGGELLNGAALKAVAENTELEITLTAKSGYKAVKLVINGKPETNSAGGKTIAKKVKVTQALTVSGNVVQESTPLKTFAVTVTPPLNGTITVKKGGELLNGAALKAVEENTELEITLTAKDGYKTVKLVVGDEEKTDSTDNGKTITKKVTVTKALTVSGEVAKDTVKVIVRGDDHVTVNEPKNFEVKLGSDWTEVKKKINVVYAVGWEEAGWHIKDKDGGTLTESFTFTKDTIVFAVSKKSLEKFKVTLTPPEHGRIKVLKGGIELSQTELNGILEGTVLTFVLEANEGYKPTVLTVNGEKYKIPNGNSISATVEITKNTEASGEVKRILKIAVTKPENGSIGVTKKGVIVFESEYGKLQEGTELTFKLSANTGYKVKSLTIAQEGGNTDNYTDVENGTISHTLNITANLTVSGIVEKDTAHNTLESEKIDVDEVSFNMVKIPAANNITFIKKTISLSAYRIAETEVTQKLYQKIMGENPSHFTSEPAAGETQELRPVEKVSWYEAAAFCNELTKKIDGNTANCVYYSDKAKQNAYTKEDGKAGNPVHADWTKTGYRLPTEAEWEYAAKGGTTHKYSGSDNLEDVAWGGLSTDFKTHEVKKKAKNGYGLYDMSGNVGEWCWDWYVKFPPLEGQNSKDPKGPETGTNKMERGGDFSYTTYTNLDYACTNRDETSVSVTPDKKEDYIGFRLAKGALTVPVIEKFNVTFGVEGQGGTLEASVDGKTDKSGSIEVESGKTVIFKAKPEDGYKVKSWAGLPAPDPADSPEASLLIHRNADIKVSFENVNLPPPVPPEDGKVIVKFIVKGEPNSGVISIGIFDGEQDNINHDISAGTEKTFKMNKGGRIGYRVYTKPGFTFGGWTGYPGLGMKTKGVMNGIQESLTITAIFVKE